MKHIYILFDNTASAIAASEFCESHSLEGRLAPVPSRLRAGCGLAWKIDPDCEAGDAYFDERIKELTLLFDREKMNYREIICFEVADIHHIRNS